MAVPASRSAEPVVDPVPDDREIGVCQVNPDLMRAAGFDPDIDEARDLRRLAHSHKTLRILAALDHGHSLALGWIAADRRIDREFLLLGDAPDDRLVLLDHGSLGPLLKESEPPCVGAADDDQPGRIAVEPVHDAGPLRPGHADVRRVMKQRVDKRAGAMPRGRVDNHAGRLVDRDDVLVFIDDVQRNLLGQQLILFDRRDRDLDDLARRDLECTAANLAIDQHVAIVDQTLEPGSAHVRDVRGDEFVEARVLLFALWKKRQCLALYGGTTFELEIQPIDVVSQFVIAHARRPRSALNSMITNVSNPSVSAASATLNRGHGPNTKKSVTAPSAKRSIRLEIAPPAAAPSAIAPASPVARSVRKTTSASNTKPTATRASVKDVPSPSPNAMPRFSVNSRPITPSISQRVSPHVSQLVMTDLVAKSASPTASAAPAKAGRRAWRVRVISIPATILGGRVLTERNAGGNDNSFTSSTYYRRRRHGRTCPAGSCGAARAAVARDSTRNNVDWRDGGHRGRCRARRRYPLRGDPDRQATTLPGSADSS